MKLRLKGQISFDNTSKNLALNLIGFKGEMDLNRKERERKKCSIVVQFASGITFLGLCIPLPT